MFSKLGTIGYVVYNPIYAVLVIVCAHGEVRGCGYRQGIFGKYCVGGMAGGRKKNGH